MQTQTIVSMESFGLSGGLDGSDQDCTLAVYRALQYCREVERPKLVFPKGRYHFWPERAVERHYYISNHDQEQTRHIVFPLLGFQHLTVDGQGSEFIFHGVLTPFVIDESQHVTLMRFSVDWERPLLSQGTVTSVGDDFFDVQVPPQYTYEIIDRKLHFHGEGWTERVKGIIEMDPQTCAPAYQSGDWLNYGHYAPISVDEIAPGLVRHSGSMKRKPAIGSELVFQCGKRNAAGIFIKDSEDVRVESVDMYHAFGMGVIAQRTTDIHLDAFCVKRKPGSTRLFTTRADATHFVYCRGTIRIENCLFENQMDDPCNVHGIYLSIEEQIADDTLLLKLNHFQQTGVRVIGPGDALRFVSAATFAPYAQSTVKQVEPVNRHYWLVTFDKPIPPGVAVRDLAENITWSPDLIVHHCTVRANRARGFLITSPGKVLLEHNTISAPGAGIKISGDANSWYESGAVQDVTIRSNTFLDCNYCYPHWGKAVIDIDPVIQAPETLPACYHRNIRIEGNRFRTYELALVKGYSVDGLIFTNNVIETTDHYPKHRAAVHAIELTASRNVSISGNRIIGEQRTARIGDQVVAVT
ncbi:right-handed parallel beta-helix repeat-containing protein [Paenibacillus allorhizosphaerae]|uniref:Alpha-1,3-galactosidase B n=1 Tax=Paenibacillus allorhizosphaerae TaxID=2849866 RepID=A0ABN7THR6_9BACL|nr:right-handed parallel beta-helix repeat-containing protein [Paenibacillus allorhizosphaerae]CAG7627809.1 Alpha-1,3-galactosidase B [Paenibacillus allorhizosphaerae]